MDLSLLIAPVSGAVIGYITNCLAIKMLFRPRKAYYLGKLHIPFTPGLIPKEKSRLAASIGKTVAKELLNPETLSSALLSDEMTQKFADGLNRIYTAGTENTATLLDIATNTFGDENVVGAMGRVKNDASLWLYGKLNEADIPSRAADAVDEYLHKKSTGLAGLMVGLFAGGDQIRDRVREGVTEYLEANGQELVSGLVDHESVKLMNMTLSELLLKFDGNREEAMEFALKAYRSAVTGYLGRALSALDISQIISDRINSFDNETLEKLILNVMQKELNAITWLGALLGGIMGFVNLLT